MLYLWFMLDKSLQNKIFFRRYTIGTDTPESFKSSRMQKINSNNYFAVMTLLLDFMPIWHFFPESEQIFQMNNYLLITNIQFTDFIGLDLSFQKILLGRNFASFLNKGNIVNKIRGWTSIFPFFFSIYRFLKTWSNNENKHINNMQRT